MRQASMTSALSATVMSGCRTQVAAVSHSVPTRRQQPAIGVLPGISQRLQRDSRDSPSGVEMTSTTRMRLVLDRGLGRLGSMIYGMIPYLMTMAFDRVQA